MNSSTPFVAIDAGYKNIGIAYFLGNVVQQTYIMTAEDFYKHCQEFEQLIDSIVPEVVVFEKPLYNNNALKNGYKVIETMGVEKCVLQKLNVRYFEVSPTEVKHIVTGSGKADKEAIKKAVIEQKFYTEENIIKDIKANKNFSYKKEQQYHLWDAIGIGITYLKKHEKN